MLIEHIYFCTVNQIMQLFLIYRRMTEVELAWTGVGSDVKVAGQFNSWEPSDATRGVGDTWTLKLTLPPARNGNNATFSCNR